MRARVFYAEFIKQGDLVFDIGANVGDRTNFFHNIGAKVVAVEAQPHSYAALEKRFRDVEGVTPWLRAVSDKAGEVKTIHWCAADDTSGSASISESWIQKAKDNQIFLASDWSLSAKVETTTIYNMCKIFGMPAFVKIDTEGSEYDVFRGMLKSVKAFSFEFHPWDFEKVERILDLMATTAYEYRISQYESYEFTTPEWLSAPAVLEALVPSKGDKILYGDIYARLKS